MTAYAIEWLVPLGVLCPFQRMIMERKLPVASHAKRINFVKEKTVMGPGMRRMAGEAITCGNRSMHLLFCKSRFVMAPETEARGRGRKPLLSLEHMGDL